MSMNLAFEIDGVIVDFPFQTRTNLSYAVYNAKNTSARLKLIEIELKTYGWRRHDIDDLLDKCRKLLSNRKFKLIII